MKKLIIYILPLLLSFTAEADKPIITAVRASPADAAGNRNFHVSVRHADEGWDHYADGFEIQTPDGTLIAKRILHHPHVNEQPFTREKYGVKIPKDLKEIHILAHDTSHGYGPRVSIQIPTEKEPIKVKP